MKKLILILLMCVIADARVVTFLYIGDSVSKIGPKATMTTLVSNRSEYLVMIATSTNNGEFQNTIDDYQNILGQYWDDIDYLVINFGIHEIQDEDADTTYYRELCFLSDTIKKYDKVLIWNQTTALRNDPTAAVIRFNAMAERVFDSILDSNRYRICRQYEIMKADSMMYLWDADGIHYSVSETAYPYFAANTMATIDTQIMSEQTGIYYQDSVKIFYVGIPDSIKAIYERYTDSVINITALPSGVLIDSTMGIIRWDGTGSTQSQSTYTIKEYKDFYIQKMQKSTPIKITISNEPAIGTRKNNTCNCIY